MAKILAAYTDLELIGSVSSARSVREYDGKLAQRIFSVYKTHLKVSLFHDNLMLKSTFLGLQLQLTEDFAVCVLRIFDVLNHMKKFSKQYTAKLYSLLR